MDAADLDRRARHRHAARRARAPRRGAVVGRVGGSGSARGSGRRADAIALARAHPEGGSWYAAEAVAELLIGDGRTEEATAVLAQHGTRGTRAAHLIELGRIQDPRPVTAGPWATV